MNRAAAFSLAEVAIAMALLAFVFMGIIGLLNVGLSAGKAAQTDTIVAECARSMLTSVRTNDPATFAGSTNFFKYDGSANSSSNGAYFQCVVTKVAPPALTTPAISSADMAGLRIEFQYPLDSPTNRNTKVLHASFIRQP